MAFFHPLRDLVGVGASEDAQLGNGLGLGLLRAARVEADLDAAHFGQQVGAPPGDLPQLGDRGSRRVLSRIALPDLTPGRSDQFCHDQPVRVGPVTIMSHPARIEHACYKSKLALTVSAPRPAGKESAMEPLTPASPDGLPPLGELIADEPFWRYPLDAMAGQGIAHLRVWLTAGAEPGYLAVVTEPGSAAEVTESAACIWAALARRYGPSLAVLEHHPAPETGEGAETLDLVRVGADGSPHWLRVWPTPEDNPRHAGLELWMAVHGHQVVSKPASWFDWCNGDES